MSAVAKATKPITFPSKQWFKRLASLMREDRARHEHLGYIDCTAGFVITDNPGDESSQCFLVTFEEFDAKKVQEVDAAAADKADFLLQASYATWRQMIESIVSGDGRPDLEQTLNRLSHMGTPMKLEAASPVKADLYFRYAQSLQEFFNAAARMPTRFA